MNITEYKLNLKSLTVWQIRITIVLIVLFFIITVTFDRNNILRPILNFSVVFVSAFYLLIYFPLKYRSYSFFITEDKIFVNRGVIIKSKKIIYNESIEYITEFTTPLDKILDLSIILIHTAGGTIILPDISLLHAQKIRQIGVCKKQGAKNV